MNNIANRRWLANDDDDDDNDYDNNGDDGNDLNTNNLL